MTKQYILTDITRKIGSLNHDYIYDLTWLDTDDLKIYMMIVDASYRNYSKWQHIIHNNGLGIYTGLRKKNVRDKDGTAVMDADSTPQCINFLTEDEIFKIVEYCHQRAGLSD